MIDPKQIVNLQGKDYVLFSGVLGHAHKSGLESTETELLQIPSAENGHLAIVKATAWFRNGENERLMWVAHGDASPANTKGPIQHALIRMAETRAIGRVLRMATNLGVTMFEELGPEGEPTNSHQSASEPRTAPQRARHDPQDEGDRQEPVSLCEVCGTQVPTPVATAARKQWGTVLCIAHGRERRLADKEAPAQLQGA